MKQHGKRQAVTTRSKRYGKYMAIMLIMMVLLCFAGGIYARYVKKVVIPSNQVTAKPFYFTVDLIRDDTADNVSKEYHLYGGGAKELTFQVWNYVDEMRITKEDISYSITAEDDSSAFGADQYSIKDAGGTVISSVKNDKAVTGVQSFSAAEGKKEHKYKLAIADGYKDKTTVTVKITSSAPYEKTIEVDFVLHTTNANVLYRVEDSVGNNVARLIVMANQEIAAGEIQIDLSAVNSAANVLQIDMTDSDIWTWSDGVPSNPPVVAADPGWLNGNVIVTVAMKAGESLEIQFFKTDMSKSYQTNDTGSGLENIGLTAKPYIIKLREDGVSGE